LHYVAGLDLTFLRDLPRRCLVHVAARKGSSWSAFSGVTYLMLTHL